MSKPYYKCNAVSSVEKTSEELPLSVYIYIVIIVAITGIINKSLFEQQSEIKHKTFILAGLSFLLFIILILWMVGSIRSEGFRGRNGRGRNGRRSASSSTPTPVTASSSTPTPMPTPTPTKKTNLSPTLLTVLPIMALALFGTIGHIIYKGL